jgi:predicted small lipoprotein YifL
LARDQLSLARALVFALVFSLPLAGCGRKGPLDPPPDSSVPTPPAPQGSTFTSPTAPAGAAQPAPVQPPAPVQKKTFFLDPLIQ